MAELSLNLHTVADSLEPKDKTFILGWHLTLHRILYFTHSQTGCVPPNCETLDIVILGSRMELADRKYQNRDSLSVKFAKKCFEQYFILCGYHHVLLSLKISEKIENLWKSKNLWKTKEPVMTHASYIYIDINLLSLFSWCGVNAVTPVS